MEEDTSKFFPKGVTALIVLRALDFIHSYTDLADYLAVLGKNISKGKRRIYRQRRNKVLKYALDKLSYYGLVRKGEKPGTYSSVIDYEGYMNFLKENASILYEWEKFKIALAIREMFQAIDDAYLRVLHSISESSEVDSKEVEELEEVLKKVKDFMNKKDSRIYAGLVLFHRHGLEPYFRDTTQIQTLESLFDFVEFEAGIKYDHMTRMIFDRNLQSEWITYELVRFLGVDNVNFLDVEEQLIFSFSDEFFGPPFNAVEGEAIAEILGTDHNVEVEKETEHLIMYSLMTSKYKTDPGWLFDFKINLMETIPDLKPYVDLR